MRSRFRTTVKQTDRLGNVRRIVFHVAHQLVIAGGPQAVDASSDGENTAGQLGIAVHKGVRATFEPSTEPVRQYAEYRSWRAGQVL